MEAICVKFDEDFIHTMEDVMKKNRYSTKAEFIREAVREKLSRLEKEKILRNLYMLKGASKRKTSDGELHAAREKAFKILESKFDVK
ncbi:hypothetical protein HY638_02900 [Candidatus Woesearchaeota archaeon]|nr:hypothetical protein [Candidatus Woesearchaeota archaeon]